MDSKWKELYDAAKQVLKPRDVSKIIEAGGVSVAVESVSGKIYVGVCVDTACTLGVCAERNAIFMMIPDMNSNFRKNRMSNARIQQLVTLLYMHKMMVESDGIVDNNTGRTLKGSFTSDIGLVLTVE